MLRRERERFRVAILLSVNVHVWALAGLSVAYLAEQPAVPEHVELVLLELPPVPAAREGRGATGEHPQPDRAPAPRAAEPVQQRLELALVKQEPAQRKPEPVQTRQEHALRRPEPAQRKLEPMQRKPEPALRKPEPAQTRLEPARMKLEPALRRPELARVKPEPALRRPEHARVKAEPALRKPEPAQPRPEPARVKAEHVQSRPEHARVKAEPAQSRPEHARVKAEPALRKPEPAQTRQEPARVKAEPAQQKPDPALVKPELAQPSLELAKRKRDLVLAKLELASLPAEVQSRLPAPRELDSEAPEPEVWYQVRRSGPAPTPRFSWHTASVARLLRPKAASRPRREAMSPQPDPPPEDLPVLGCEGPLPARLPPGTLADPGGSRKPRIEAIQARVDAVTPLVQRTGREECRALSGVTRIRFFMNRQGYPAGYQVLGSSGSDCLDLQVDHVLHMAEPYPYLAGWVPVKVKFRI